jgi:peptidoglycan L-alanyl-D-glutamate endopeptidase CwlK
MTVSEAQRLLNQYTLPDETWDKHTNSRLINLHPLARIPFAQVVNQIYSQLGKKIRLTSDGNLRTFAEQNILYGHSRTATELKAVGLDVSLAKPLESWKTNAIGGESFHNYGLAVDAVEIISGQPYWYMSPDIVKVFKDNGWSWGGDWRSKDTPHFELTFGFTVDQLFEMYNNHQIDSNNYIKFL